MRIVKMFYAVCERCTEGNADGGDSDTYAGAVANARAAGWRNRYGKFVCADCVQILEDVDEVNGEPQ